MESGYYDYIVVGLGGVGSAVVYRCAKQAAARKYYTLVHLINIISTVGTEACSSACDLEAQIRGRPMV